jgi:hypothetical protein
VGQEGEGGGGVSSAQEEVLHKERDCWVQQLVSEASRRDTQACAVCTMWPPALTKAGQRARDALAALGRKEHCLLTGVHRACQAGLRHTAGVLSRLVSFVTRCLHVVGEVLDSNEQVLVSAPGHGQVDWFQFWPRSGVGTGTCSLLSEGDRYLVLRRVPHPTLRPSAQHTANRDCPTHCKAPPTLHPGPNAMTNIQRVSKLPGPPPPPPWTSVSQHPPPPPPLPPPPHTPH